jgi:hypothetical protein
MKKAQEAPDSYRIKIAKDFFAAYLANRMCVTFRTAQKYVGDEIGGLWLFLADVAIKSENESAKETFKDHISDTELVTDSDN